MRLGRGERCLPHTPAGAIMGSALGSPCWHRSPSLHTECALHGIATEPCGVHQHQPQHHVLGLRGHHREPEGTAGRALDYGEVWACGDRGRIALDPGELGPHEVSVRVAEPCGAFGLHPGEHGSWERDRNDGGRLGDEERDVPEEDCAVVGPGGEKKAEPLPTFPFRPPGSSHRQARRRWNSLRVRRPRRRPGPRSGLLVSRQLTE
jgi:hypothetical protein